MEEQILDNMEIERERGITIKAQSVRMKYKAKDGNEYTFNLIDTPGHVDFNYEVSRSLAACDGAILIVDSTQGVEAQTLANVYLAIDNNLEVLPVINKIDLPSSRPEEVKKEIEDIIGIPAIDCPCISAKTGLNVEEVLEKIVTELPCPQGDENAKTKCLIFDSYYDNYKGAIAYVRVMEGKVKVGDEILLMQAKKKFCVTEVGYFVPGSYMPCTELKAGEVGYIAASIKSLSEIYVGDTITQSSNPAEEPLKGYKKVQPMVYCGIYPIDGSEYENLKVALEIDISTGDEITPRELNYEYNSLFEDKKIYIDSYNIETILAEKVETILRRGKYNARMKDYYDIYFFLSKLNDDIDVDIFRQALENTVIQRESSEYLKDYNKILDELLINDRIHKNWNSYSNKTKYAKNIDFNDIVSLLIGLLNDNVKLLTFT